MSTLGRFLSADRLVRFRIWRDRRSGCCGPPPDIGDPCYAVLRELRPLGPRAIGDRHEDGDRLRMCGESAPAELDRQLALIDDGRGDRALRRYSLLAERGLEPTLLRHVKGREPA